ncbi:MAG: undecaprenyl-diphosphate phosphatase [Alphaproteobacteria bacterium]|nr:undecaprenyl-diphosphate phosphatase [Alphaproteobacteria bacterium]
MSLLHIAVLSVVQGLTEFLPISSSGHLILVPALLGWPDQSLIMDVAVHVGTLGAVLVYFWRDIRAMLLGLKKLVRGQLRDAGARLTILLIVGTIPAIIAGSAIKLLHLESALRSVALIGWTTFGFGIVLFVVDGFFLRVRRFEQLTVAHVFCIGLAQAIALLPGTSRSGITMTAARLFGFERPAAARFSFLLSVPAIAAAGILEGYELFKLNDPGLFGQVALAAALSCAVGFVAIAGLMAWVKRASFAPFAIYRLLLGGALLVGVYVYGWTPPGY